MSAEADFEGVGFIWMPQESFDDRMRDALLAHLAPGLSIDARTDSGRVGIRVSRPGDTTAVLNAAMRDLMDS